MKENESGILIYINERLSKWADWYIYHGDFGIGYPHKSVEARLIEGGGLVFRSNTHHIPSNELAEETEKLVNELALQNHRLANALREYYFGMGSMTCKAQRVGLSTTHFKVQVDAAKQWLIGRLTHQKPWTTNKNLKKQWL